MALDLNLVSELHGTVDQIVDRLIPVLQAEGFGVLTRIDFDSKIKEKLGKQVPRTVILGACNPQLAYEAFTRDPEVTALLPCNAVVRELTNGRVSVELVRPSALMTVLGNPELVTLAREADRRLQNALQKL